MRTLHTLLSLSSLLIAAAPLAAQTPASYHYEGHAFTNAWGDYDTSDRIVGTFTVADALPPGMPLSSVSHLITSFAFTDGVQFYTEATSGLSPNFSASTDATGNVEHWNIWLVIDSAREIYSTFTPSHGQDSGSTGTLSFGLNVGTPGTWTQEGSGLVGTPYCFGDGSGAGCPCDNEGAIGRGCGRSATPVGTLLYATGTASVAADSVELTAIDCPPTQPGIFYSGTSPIAGGNGLPFGDGLRCAGGGTVRLQVVSIDGAGVARSSIPLAAAGGLTAGDTAYYQYWFRDPIGGPCGSGWNLTNALAITWN